MDLFLPFHLSAPKSRALKSLFHVANSHGRASIPRVFPTVFPDILVVTASTGAAPATQEAPMCPFTLNAPVPSLSYLLGHVFLLIFSAQLITELTLSEYLRSSLNVYSLSFSCTLWLWTQNYHKPSNLPRPQSLLESSHWITFGFPLNFWRLCFSEAELYLMFPSSLLDLLWIDTAASLICVLVKAAFKRSRCFCLLQLLSNPTGMQRIFRVFHFVPYWDFQKNANLTFAVQAAF